MKDYLILSIISLILCLISGYIYFSSNDKIITEFSDVYESIEYYKSTTNTTSKVSLNLKNRSFVISSLLEMSFNAEDFNKEMVRGDSISVFLDSNKLIHQIKSGDKFYINEVKKEALENENKNAALFVFLFFFITLICSTIILLRKMN